MATGPAFVTQAPALTPPPTSLIRTATVIEHPDDLHWGGAMEWSPEGCADAVVVAQCVQAAKLGSRNRSGRIRFDAFGVLAYDSCSTFGMAAEDYEGRARRALAARESKAVEKEWWTATLVTANPHLAMAAAGANGGTAATTVVAGAQGLRTGLALLVQALADGNGGSGMIHARPFLVQLWYGLDLLYRDGGGKLWTGEGNQVVAGAGYPGTGPAAEARTASSEWAFATDAVDVHRGPVSILGPGGPGVENLDYANNEVIVRAERLYGLVFNGCVNAAVQFDPTLST